MVVAVEVLEVASAASPASNPMTMVIGTVHDRNRQNASTGPMFDCVVSVGAADRNPPGVEVVEGVDGELLIVWCFRSGKRAP